MKEFLEQARKNLLKLGLRNNLINFREGSYLSIINQQDESKSRTNSKR